MVILCKYDCRVCVNISTVVKNSILIKLWRCVGAFFVGKKFSRDAGNNLTPFSPLLTERGGKAMFVFLYSSYWFGKRQGEKTD